MHRKQVWRYYCDFCKKANCSAPHMTKHERGCTANPDRICGLCKNAEKKQASFADLVQALNMDLAKKKADQEQYHPDEMFYQVTDEDLVNLEDCADGCPACMLTAIRANDLEDGALINFDYKGFAARFWQGVNEERELSDYHG